MPAPSSPTPRVAVQPRAVQSKAPLPLPLPPPPPPDTPSPVAAPSPEPIAAVVAQLLIALPETEPVPSPKPVVDVLTVGDVIAMIQTAEALAPEPVLVLDDAAGVADMQTADAAPESALAPEPELDGFITIIWADLVVRLAVSAGHVSVTDIDNELALRAVFPRCDIELTKSAPKGVDMRTAAWDQLEARDAYDVFFGLVPDTTYYALVRENEEEAEKEDVRREALRIQTEATLAERRQQSAREEALFGTEIDSATSAAQAALNGGAPTNDVASPPHSLHQQTERVA